jgi:hypothetical protein
MWPKVIGSRGAARIISSHRITATPPGSLAESDASRPGTPGG